MTNVNQTAKWSLLTLGLLAVLASRAVPASGQESDVSVAPPPLDSDRDGIPDNVDNCPFRKNAEQFDADHDGPGDECDVTFFATGSQQPGYLNIVLPAFTKHKNINLGQILNTSREPVQWDVVTQSDDFDRLPSGTLLPGQSASVLVSLDATKIVHGEPVHEQVFFHYDENIFQFDIWIIIEDEPDPNYCDYEVEIYKIEVTDGQGVSEGKLEVEVVETLDLVGSNPVGDWPAAGNYVKLSDGDKSTPAWPYYLATVPAGTAVSLPLNVKIIEHDSGFNGPDDIGDVDTEIEFTCSGMNHKDFSNTVSLGSRGKVKVTTRASWDEE